MYITINEYLFKLSVGDYRGVEDLGPLSLERIKGILYLTYIVDYLYQKYGTLSGHCIVEFLDIDSVMYPALDYMRRQSDDSNQNVLPSYTYHFFLILLIPIETRFLGIVFTILGPSCLPFLSILFFDIIYSKMITKLIPMSFP